MAMSDGSLSLACLAAADTLSTGTPPRPGAYYLNGGWPCYHVYECADGKWLSIACMEPWFWRRLCVHLGCESFADAQFDASRFPEIFERLRRRFREKPRDAWFAELRAEEICATPVYDMAEALDDEHNRCREMIVSLEHPTFGAVTQIGVAPKLSETPGAVRTLAPRPGEHSAEILRELGYAAAEIAALTQPRGE